jgi:hypothetical protein
MGLDDGGSGWDALLKGIDLDQPVGMLNQLKFRDQALYEPGSGEPPCSGREAFDRYSDLIMPILKGMGAGLILNRMVELIGPQREWDMTFVVRYRRALDLVTLPKNEHYRAAVHHRTAAVADSRLVMMRFLGDTGL